MYTVCTCTFIAFLHNTFKDNVLPQIVKWNNKSSIFPTSGSHYIVADETETETRKMNIQCTLVTTMSISSCSFGSPYLLISENCSYPCFLATGFAGKDKTVNTWILNRDCSRKPNIVLHGMIKCSRQVFTKGTCR